MDGEEDDHWNPLQQPTYSKAGIVAHPVTQAINGTAFHWTVGSGWPGVVSDEADDPMMIGLKKLELEVEEMWSEWSLEQVWASSSNELKNAPQI